MPFHPEVLSEATLKDLARNLQLGAKIVLPKQPLKLSQAQELLARTLGYNSWHATITQAKSHPNKTGQQRLAELSDAVDRAKDPKNFSKFLTAVKTEADIPWTDDIRTSDKLTAKLQEARDAASELAKVLEEKIQQCPRFWVDGIEFHHEEVCANDGLLPVLLFKVFPRGVKGITLLRCDSSLAAWRVLFTGSSAQRNRVVAKLEQALKAVPYDSTQAQSPSLDSWYREFWVNADSSAKWIARHIEGGSTHLIGKPL